jgi:hypothetical protein
MQQFELFNNDKKIESEYTSKIKTPVYEPSNKKPHSLELVDNTKVKRLIHKIKSSNLSEEDKRFLHIAAYRHLKFNYSLIADYYAHSSEEFQELAEESGLVIIDFKKAIELGYVKLAEEIAQLYLKDYEE